MQSISSKTSLVYRRNSILLEQHYILQVRKSVFDDQPCQLITVVLDREDDIGLTFKELEECLSKEGINIEIVSTVYKTTINRDFPLSDYTNFQPFNCLVKPPVRIISYLHSNPLCFELCTSPFLPGPELFTAVSNIVEESTTNFYLTLLRPKTLNKATQFYNKLQSSNFKPLVFDGMPSLKELGYQIVPKPQTIAMNSSNSLTLKKAAPNSDCNFEDYEQIIISRTRDQNVDDIPIANLENCFIVVARINYGPIIMKVNHSKWKQNELLPSSTEGEFVLLYLSERTSVREVKEMLEIYLPVSHSQRASARLKIVIKADSWSDDVKALSLFEKNETLSAKCYWNGTPVPECDKIKYGLPDLTRPSNMIEVKAIYNHRLGGYFSLLTTEWRYVSPGLNIEGICTNSNCRSGGNVSVIHRQHYGSFDIALMKYSCLCPACSLPFKFDNFIFVDCAYIFKGLYYEAGKSVEVQSDVPIVVQVPNGYLTLSNEQASRGANIDWAALTIITVPLACTTDLLPKEHCRLCSRADSFDKISKLCKSHKMHDYCCLYFNLENCIFCTVEKIMSITL